MQQRQLKNRNNVQILPITHTDSVRDSSGNTVTSLLGAIEDEVALVSESTLENKTYSPSTFSGLGRQVLHKNITGGNNVLTQDMFKKGPSGARVDNDNTVYVIQYDYSLNNTTITVPSGCTLDFQGGSLCNGTININGAKILPSYEYLEKYIADCAPSGVSPLIITGFPATGTCKFADGKPSWWGGSAWVDVDPNAVLKTPQTLTSAEKSQVKQNIGLDTDLSGLQTQISDEVTRATAAENTLSSSKANKATTLSGYGITDAYTKTEVNGLVSTPHQNYVTVSATSGTTAASQVLPTSGQSTDTIYRVSNWDGSTNSFNVTKYSEYAWNGSAYVFLRVESQIDEVFDITVYNSNTTYTDLADALGSGGANIPQTLRRGGMSVKFVQTSDNKYKQFRLISDSFNTTVTNWQSENADDTIVEESENLAKSGAVAKALDKVSEISKNKTYDQIPEEIKIYDDEDNIIADITPNGCNFKNLQSNGKNVVATNKISETESTNENEEQIWQNNEGTEDYAKIGSYGIKAKGYFDMNGIPVGESKRGILISGNTYTHFIVLNNGQLLCRQFGLGGLSQEWNGLLDIQKMYIGEFSNNSIVLVQLLGNSDGDTIGPISVCRGSIDNWIGQWTGGVHVTSGGYKDAISESVKVFVDGVEKSANGLYYGNTICIDAINRLYIPQTVTGADLSSATECFLENRLWTLTDKMNVKVTLKTLNDIYVTLYYGCQIYRYDMTELYAPNNKKLIQYPIVSKVALQTKEQEMLYKNGNHRYNIEMKPYGLGTFDDNDGGDANIGYFFTETFGKDYFVIIKNNSAYKLNQGQIICWEADYNYYIG